MKLNFVAGCGGLVLLSLGCSATSGDGQAPASPHEPATAGASGTGGGAGSDPNGQAGSGGAGGSSTRPIDSGSSSQADGDADGGIVSPTMPDGQAEAMAQAKDFTCSQVMGLLLTSQWYLAGFETGIDNARWQLKWAEHSYVDEWAKVDSPFWMTPVVSPCAQHSTSPDRVVFVALSWTIMAEKDWEAAITGDVDNIKLKYPDVRSIDLLAIVRGPANKACGADPNAYAESTRIPAALDEAIAQVASRYPGLVHVGPKVEAAACSDFSGGGPHLTNAGNAMAAQKYSAYYAKLP